MNGLPADGWGGTEHNGAVCYDVLNQVPFDKTVLSTSVFIVSPVSPSTKAGQWHVSVLVRWGVWGAALAWPPHLSGPRAEAACGLSDHEPDCLEHHCVNLKNVSSGKSQYLLHFVLQVKVVWDRSDKRMDLKSQVQAILSPSCSGHLAARLFHVAIFKM